MDDASQVPENLRCGTFSHLEEAVRLAVSRTRLLRSVLISASNLVLIAPHIREEVALGKPFTDEEEGITYFKLEALIKFLRNQKFDSYSRGQIQERLKELNDNGTANGKKYFDTTKGQQKQMRVWWVPSFNTEVQVPSIELESEVPF